jgi:hypothetical protein
LHRERSRRASEGQYLAKLETAASVSFSHPTRETVCSVGHRAATVIRALFVICHMAMHITGEINMNAQASGREARCEGGVIR